ncbi:DUF11 domain-containing protein [Bacillus cereus]|nr:DUF11 domain-containing protein [Bacillus cereus]
MAIATIGNRLTYTITVENTGTLPANNTVFTDPIPAGTTFVTNSVTVNGVPTPGNPATGITIPTIPPGGSTTITFQVDVTSIPEPPVASNEAAFQYEFQPAPNTPTITRTTDSNIVNTDLFNANVALSKAVNKSFATIGDIITYTITATNQASLPANNVNITDAIPSGTAFVPGSVTINGAPSASNPATGIVVGTIPANGIATITFQVRVTNIPAQNPIQNVANSTFQYNPPNQPPINRNSTSNPAQTTINAAIVNPQKVASRQIASIGDIITYTVTIPNTGNIPVTNATVIDPIPAGTTFVPNSVLVNGISVPNATPANIPVGTIAPGQSATVSFQVQVTSLPPNGTVTNEANITFTSQPDPNEPPTTTTTTTTITETTISTAIINPVKTANRQNVTIGDIITYTITTQNTGNITATNVIVTDPIPPGTTFIPNSVTINGASQPEVNPISGIQVGTLGPGQSAIVTFQVQVTSLPPGGVIENSGNTTFTFQPDPTRPPITTTNPTPPVTVTVTPAIPNPIKSVNRTIVNIGDTVTYTITFENAGNVPATNVTITDTIPAGTTFIPNSVLVNNSPAPNTNPVTGIPVGTVDPGETVTVSFRVLVNEIPPSGTITNQGSVTFTYQPEPGQPPITVTEPTNPTNVSVRNGTVVSTKSADRSFANIGDVITYTIVLQNTGNVPATNVSLTDPIPGGTTFIPNSVTVNGASQPGANPANGIALGTVNPNEPTTVTFQVRVTSVPPNGNVVNQGSVTSTYTVDPTQPPITTTTPTPTTTTPVETAIITPTKTADHTTIGVGDTITYTISFTNVGTVPATNTVLTDPNPAGTTFVPNSVTINGITAPGSNPANGILIGTLNPGQTVTVTYQATVTSLPPDGIIRNQATFNYQYQPDPTQPPITAITPTPTVEVTVVDPNPTTTKTADQQYVDIGDTITFTMTFLNKGNVAATGVIAQDILPAGVSFVPGSVIVNGTPQPGANPEVGVNVGTVLPGQTATVSFQGIVESAPPGGIIQNQGSFTFIYQPNPDEPPITTTTPTPETTTAVNTATLNPQKTANVSSADLNDIITYTLSFQNTGNVPATNVVITDPIPDGTTFIPNSVTVNGTPQPGANPEAGISLGTLAPSQTATIIFQIQVTSIPPSGQIINQGTATFNYTVNPNQPPVTKTETTPQTVTPVQPVIIGPTKTANATFVQPNDIVTYTVSFTNQGSIPATNVIITDALPSGTTFIPNSVTINGIPQPGLNPETGIPTGTVNSGDTVTITFQIRVDTIPPSGTISNTATVTYTSQPNPTEPPITTTTTTPPAVVTVQIANPDPIKTVDKAIAQVGDTLTYTITLNNIGNIPANDINITDALPAGTAFVPGSIVINGVPQPGATPNNILIGTLNPDEIAVVTFQVTVLAIPPGGVVRNTVTITYTSQPNPTEPPITTTTTTPPAETTIVEINVQPTKTANQQVVNVGDVLTYTVTIPNNSSTPITSVIVTDPIPTGTTFVPSSVTIDGISHPNLNPATGIFINSIAPNQTATITFQITVVSVPPNGIITNQATVTFTYEPGPGIPPVTTTTTTTPIDTTVIEVNVQPIKTANRQSVSVGDVLTYTISVPNNSSIPITNVIVTDPIPVGTTFIPNSVIINSVPQANLNPANGITINSIAPNQTVTITFQITVVSVPPSGIITNQATVTFTYEPGPGIPPVTTTTTTPPIDTTVIEINIQPTKTANRQSVRVGDVLTYTISVPNNSSIPITNVIVTDPIPAGTTFVPNSVTINGVPQPNLNPANGITINSIAPNQTATITFQITVVSVPPSGIITNQATVTFTYEPGPGIPPVTTTTTTPPVTIPISPPSPLLKTSDRNTAELNDFITYTITFTNNNNIPANNVIITDPLPPEATFYPNSVTVNGVIRPGTNPTIGIIIGTVNPGESVVVRFIVQVTAEPRGGLIRNTARIRYTLQPDPTKPPISVDETSDPNIITFIGPFVSPNLNCFFDGTRFIRRGWDSEC